MMAKATMRATGGVEEWLDHLTPGKNNASDAADLRQIGAALNRLEDTEKDVERAQKHLASAVKAARKQGRSWSAIGMVLGVSKQAAQQRFGD